MSEVVRQELLSLETEKLEIEQRVTQMVRQAQALYTEREAVMSKLRKERWRYGTVDRQMKKLEEFLEIE